MEKPTPTQTRCTDKEPGRGSRKAGACATAELHCNLVNPFNGEPNQVRGSPFTNAVTARTHPSNTLPRRSLPRAGDDDPLGISCHGSSRVQGAAQCRSEPGKGRSAAPHRSPLPTAKGAPSVRAPRAHGALVASSHPGGGGARPPGHRRPTPPLTPRPGRFP